MSPGGAHCAAFGRMPSGPIPVNTTADGFASPTGVDSHATTPRVVLGGDRFARNRGAGAGGLDLSVDPSLGPGYLGPRDRPQARGSTLHYPG